ncbi:MAG: transposase [Holosporaceae bacterium]|jgi:transposase|nr:transposase [Holosporaceae bacterium]
MLSECYSGQKIAIIMDGAGWHRSKGLKTPENTDIFLLPPYSPELNPVERFCGHLKKNVLHNRLFESLEEIENSLQTFLDGLQNNTIAQLCKNNYLVI